MKEYAAAMYHVLRCAAMVMRCPVLCFVLLQQEVAKAAVVAAVASLAAAWRYSLIST